jgi:hypothetical protein
LTSETLVGEPRGDSVFVFTNRARSRVKVLAWDGTEYLHFHWRASCIALLSSHGKPIHTERRLSSRLGEHGAPTFKSARILYAAQPPFFFREARRLRRTFAEPT